MILLIGLIPAPIVEVSPLFVAHFVGAVVLVGVLLVALCVDGEALGRLGSDRLPLVF